jgi:hypothetical protein
LSRASARRLDHVAHGRVDLHAALLQAWGLAIHGSERGPQYVAGHAVGRVQDHVEGLAVVVCEVLVGGELVGLQEFVEHELQVSPAEEGGRHGRLLS